MVASSRMTNPALVQCHSSAEFYCRLKVLQLSSGVGTPGAVKWDLALCLLLAWIIVYFCIWKGIKTSGKVKHASRGIRGVHGSPV